MLARMMQLWMALLLAKCLMISRIDSEPNVLQGAGHAVLRTLYSRAYRIGLNGDS